MRNRRIYNGGAIRKYRQLKGLSQEDLGFLVGSDASPIGKIERNEANPTVATLAKIADALEMPMYELFEGGETDVEGDPAFIRIKHLLGRMNCGQRRRVAEIVEKVAELTFEKTIDKN